MSEHRTDHEDDDTRIDEVAALVTKQSNVALWQWLGAMFVVTGMVACVLLLILLLNKVIDQGDEIHDTVDKVEAIQAGNRSLLEVITSCTTPKGECAKAGAAQQLEQLGASSEVSIAANACSAYLSRTLGPNEQLADFADRIRVCTNVLRELSQDE